MRAALLLSLSLAFACASSAPAKKTAVAKKPATELNASNDKARAPAPAKEPSTPLVEKQALETPSAPEPAASTEAKVSTEAPSPVVPSPVDEWIVVSKQRGIASYYHDGLIGNLTANGERYRANKKTCAHKKLPFGTMVDVVDIDTQKSVRCRINDRGPFVKGRIIDLSKVLAKELGLLDRGITRVEVRRLKRNKNAF